MSVTHKTFQPIDGGGCCMCSTTKIEEGPVTNKDKTTNHKNKQKTLEKEQERMCSTMKTKQYEVNQEDYTLPNDEDSEHEITTCRTAPFETNNEFRLSQ